MKGLILSNLKLLENSHFYISEESKDIHYQYIKREIFDLLIYDTPFCQLPSRGLVLDVGANIGMFAHFAITRKNNKVICFEPAQNCLPALRKNLDFIEFYLNKPIVIEKGAWSKTDTLLFFEHSEFSGCNRIVDVGENPNTGEVFKIEVVSIDETVKDLDLNRVDFIKMDVEGAELEALKGASGTIKKFKPKMAISAYHKPQDEVELVDYIKSIADYKITIINHTYIGIKIAYCY